MYCIRRHDIQHNDTQHNDIMELSLTTFLALPLNVRLGWKWPAVNNALAYNSAILINSQKVI
jgi:hypothetical protein